MEALGDDLERLARVGTALADDSRRRILWSLLDGPRYPAELADDLGLTRANTSNHLACLRGCGLVVAEPEGRRVRYELADPRLGEALRSLAEVVLAVDSACDRHLPVPSPSDRPSGPLPSSPRSSVAVR